VLVVSRFPGEDIILTWGPTTIVVRVCGISGDNGDRVRVGIQAPQRVQILRRELVQETEAVRV
jgi:carbon storage regulator CsrA